MASRTGRVYSSRGTRCNRKSNAWKTAMKHLLPIHGTLEMHYDLNNRYMHIDYVSKSAIQSAIQSAKMAL